MFKYRLHTEDGLDLGEAAYVRYLRPGDMVLTTEAGKLCQLRVLDLVPVSEKHSPYDGLLRVEAAQNPRPTAPG
jgi:hypothetical protein